MSLAPVGPRIVATFLLAGLPASAQGDPPAPRHFDRHIAPLLAARCLECHSGPRPKGGLDLTRRASAAKGGKGGPALVPRSVEKSLLWQRVEDGEMPPRHPLDEAEKGLLRAWIAAGATWGTDPIDPFRYTTDRRAGYDWWSLRPLRDPGVPDVADTDWPLNPIDHFVLRRLADNGLSPSPPAEPRVLVRRLFHDLVGLPPDPETVERFARDPSEEAYRRLVDELLASPRYGERWGRHWLDVARFGESDGFERNNPRPNAWPYRDWVIAAFNDDLPYDEFARRQLAGDLEAPGTEGAAAVGFLVAGVHNTVVGSSERMKRLARQDELEEIVGTVGQTFLGLTVNCARCHDHKFDPVRTEEYYRLIAALDGVNHGERPVPPASVVRERARLQKEIAALRTELADLDASARKAILAEREKAPKGEPAERPRPYASWDFETDFRDGVGRLHGQARGGARIEGGALVLDGEDDYVETAPLDRDLAEKTLEAWVLLDGLGQRGGGVVSVEALGGGVFDAIVFGEREPRRWMAGSEFFRRTQSFNGPEEDRADREPVHIALVYRADGTITAYRNGNPYGRAYNTTFNRFEAGKAHVVFGMRHAPAGSNKMLKGKVLRANLYDRALTPDAVAASAGVESDYVSEEAILGRLSPGAKARRLQLRERLAEGESRLRELEARAAAKVYTVIPGNPGAMRVHVRGSVTEFGEPVTPGGVASVPGAGADFGLPANAPDAARRKALAGWITAPSNPLFVRVMANRAWHYHFGKGIVETPNDLGFNGGRPSHPQLLDWLACRFREGGYSLKALHRLIVTSATYRQASRSRPEASARDRGNRLLWRYAPRRVEGEALRDAMLHVAGILNPASGGPGYEDVSITPNNGTTYYEPIPREGPEFDRRTVYRFTPRGGRSALLDTFDCPDPSTTAPARAATTTPLQALTLMNNAFVLRMAERFAERVTSEAGADRDAQIRRAWRLALGRPPDPGEERLALGLVNKRGLPALCRALFNANEFILIE